MRTLADMMRPSKITGTNHPSTIFSVQTPLIGHLQVSHADMVMRRYCQ